MKSANRKPISIRSTLTIYSLVVAALPVLLVGITALYILMVNMKQEISANNLLLTRSLAGEVEGFLSQPLNLLQQIEEVITRPDFIAPEKQNAYLEAILKNAPFMERILILDTKGRVTAVAPYDPNMDGIDLSGKKLFQSSRDPQQPYWSPTFIPPNAGQPTLSVSIRYADGIIAGYLNLGVLGKIADRFNTGMERSAIIVDNEGTVIAHQNGDLVTQRWNLSYFGNIGKGLAREEGVFPYEFKGKSYLGGVAVVKGVQWVVHISQPLDIAYAPIQHIGEITFVGMVLAMLGAIMISLPLMKKILNPLMQLTRQAGHIARGNYHSVDSKKTFRELDELSQSFNLMVKAVQKREDELKQSESEILKHTIMLENANRELKVAKETAEAASKAKTAFLANMSHELRTPLNAILGFTQLIQRDVSLPVAVQEEISIVNRCGQHLLALINDVLEIAKIEAGRTLLNQTNFDLHWFLKGIREIFLSTTTSQKLLFTMTHPPDLVRYIQADEGKLRQVLINLLGNATKFTKAGRIDLRAENKIGNEGTFVRFEIEDTGIGIAGDDIKTIFDPFIQSGAENRETGIDTGAGLGLAISRQYITLMGGSIDVTSTPGKGTAFRFEIPVKHVSAEEVIARHPRQRVTALAPGQPVYRILIVEDQDENRSLLKKVLRTTGFEVQEAVNGQEGVEMFLKWQPDLVWMDIRMPVMDGFEATRRIKATPEGSKTPVIALTAHAFEEERDQILAAGCNDVIGKPFKINEIFDVMARHLGVQYLYAEKAQQTKDSPGTHFPEDLAPDLPQKLPEDLVMSFKEAIVTIDMDRIQEYLVQVENIDGSLGKTLSRLADNFQYDRILSIITPEKT